MIDSVTLSNFRCFEDAHVEGLSRVNVIVGRNASGKTSFLEAVFLALGSGPELPLRLRAWRGLGENIAVTSDLNALQELWADLFFQFNTSARLSIQLSGSKDFNRSLRITHEPRRRPAKLRSANPSGSSFIPLDNRSVKTAPNPGSANTRLEDVREIPLRFDWRTGAGESHTIYPEIGPSGLTMPQAGEAVRAIFFHSALTFGAAEVASRFSQLSQRNAEHTVVNALREEFPFVRNLSVEVSAGTPMVQASVEGMARKAPLGLVSGGVSKLLSLLVAIADARGGVVLVDEIENGFYFDRLPSVWSLLLRFAEQNDTQLFCSTHSHESIASLKSALVGEGGAFSLLRMERKGNSHQVRHFSGEDFAAAVSQNVEIR